jgi:hypothetical protein
MVRKHMVLKRKMGGKMSGTRSFTVMAGLVLIIASVLTLPSCGGGGGGGQQQQHAPTYALSGSVSGAVLQGVTVTLSGAAAGTTSTDVSGKFSFSGLANGSYTITASMANYAFTPASQDEVISSASVTNINFTSANAYSISGNVVNGSALPIAGVTMTLTGGSLASALTATTDASGNYTFSGVVTNGTYTLTPSKSQTRKVCVGVSLPNGMLVTDYYTFSPSTPSIPISGADVTGENFVGTQIVWHGACPV